VAGPVVNRQETCQHRKIANSYNTGNTEIKSEKCTKIMNGMNKMKVTAKGIDGKVKIDAKYNTKENPFDTRACRR
jgi:hypothetical protein